MRECLSILFACYDGSTYVTWQAPNKEERVGLLAFMSLVVDGGDYGWLANNRGPKALFSCAKCRLPTSLFHQNVTVLSRWFALRRTYTREMADLRHARSLRTKAARDQSTMLNGLNSDAVDNPMY